MFHGDGSADYLARTQEITTQYEYDAWLRRNQRWHPSGTRGFVLGMAAGIFLGTKARREDRGQDSGGTPRGCF